MGRTEPEPALTVSSSTCCLIRSHVSPLIGRCRSDRCGEQLGQRALHGGGGACGLGPGHREEGVRALRLSPGDDASVESVG